MFVNFCKITIKFSFIQTFSLKKHSNPLIVVAGLRKYVYICTDRREITLIIEVMKKKFLGSLAIIVLAATLLSASQKDGQVMTKENGVYVVNTTTLGKDV